MADVKQVSSGTKLESIGTVKTVVGTVKAVDASGAERVLQAGDHVFANETIVTADGGLVLIEFANGSHLDLGSHDKIVLDSSIYTPTDSHESKGGELSAEQIQEMIARGEDPTAVTEATAAGVGAGDEGGSSFIVVDFNNTQGAVNSGFQTQGIPGPEFTTLTELPPVEDTPTTVPVVTVTVVVTPENPDNPNGGPIVTANGVSLVEGTTPNEGNTGTRPVTFNFVLDKAFTSDVTVTFTVTGSGGHPAIVGTGAGENVDVIDGTTHTVVIPAGSTVIPVTLLVVEDSAPEFNETFNITITSATNATVGAANSVQVTIVDDDITINAGSGTVNESGLEGGSHPGDSAQDHGSFNINTGGDAVQKLEVQGVDVTNGGSVGSDNGTLVVTHNADGTYSWAFTLTSPTTDAPGVPETNDFTVQVTDAGGNVATTTLSVTIIDDVPTAIDDTNSIAAGEFGPATGNVIANDTQGADSATVTAVVGTGATTAGEGTFQVVGQYGVLTIDANGDYSYTRNAGTVGGVSDAFTYTLTDGDGDVSTATLTVSIGDGAPTVTIPAAGGDGTTVNEAGLPARTGEAPGSDSASNSETTAGTINFTSVDGLGSVSLGGHALTTTAQTFSDGLTASYSYNASTGAGTITYSYTLADNTSGDNTSKSFAVVVTDADGDAAPAGNLVINIIDDVPTAANDTGSVTEGGTLSKTVLTGVLSNDISGADGWNGTGAVVGVVAGSTVANHENANVGTQISGTYGNLTLNADGSYTYVSTANAVTADAQDVFVYTVKDGDGDLTSTTLTINVANVTGVPTTTTATVYEAGIDASAGQAPGTAAAGNTEKVINADLNLQNGWSVQTAQSGSTSLGTWSVGTDGKYSYTLVHSTTDAPNAAETDSFTYTAKDANGNTVSNTVTVTIIDDVPTFTYINNGIIGNAVGTLTGTHDITFGADGEGSINLSALTTLSGVTYSAAVHNLDGSTTITAGTNGNTTGFFSLTVAADGTYSFNLLDPRPDVVKVADFGSVSGGQAVTSLTLGTGANSITFTGLDGDKIKPTSAGFGVNDGNLNTGDDFSVTFGGNKVDSVTFSIKQQSSTAFGMDWSTDAGDHGTVSFSADGNLVINPANDFSTITFSTTSGSAKVDSFSYSQNLLPDNQVLQFGVSATDGDGDTTSSQTLSLQLLGGVIGDPINGTSASESIWGTSAGETINGGGGNDILNGGGGNDILTGGTGNDVFKFSANGGTDSITDFTIGNPASNVNADVLNLHDVLSGNANYASIQTAVSNNDVSTVDNFIYFTVSGTTASLHVDPAGGGTGAVLATMQVANGTDPTTLLQTLLTNHEIQV